MFLNFAKQLLKKNIIYFLLFLQLTILLAVFLFTTILTITETAWGTMELILTFWTMLSFILLKRKLFSDSITERLKLNSFGLFRAHLLLFFFVFFFGVLVILSSFLWIWFFSRFVEDNYNIAHVKFIDPIHWTNVNYFNLIIFLFFELLLVITFMFFISSFLGKKNNFLMLLTIVLAVYLIGFGNIWNHYLVVDNFKGSYYPVWGSNSKGRLIFNLIFVPWTNLGVWATNILRYSYLPFSKFNLVNNSFISENLNLGNFLNQSYWIPLLWIPIYLFIGTLITKTRRIA